MPRLSNQIEPGKGDQLPAEPLKGGQLPHNPEMGERALDVDDIHWVALA